MIGIGRFAHARYGFCVISLCQGKIDDEDFFSFVAVEPHNYKHFKAKYNEGEHNSFQAFGEELARGWGTKPDESVVDYVARKYGIEFNVDRGFLDRLLAVADNPESYDQSPFPLKPAKVSGF